MIRRFMQPRRIPQIVISLLGVWAFAVACSAGAQTTPFDGDRAYRSLLEQVALGPRVPGSQSIKNVREMILDELGRNGFTTGTQEFNALSEVNDHNFKAINLYGIYPKGAKVRYLISAHYDCRPVADRDPDPDQKSQPIPGANDGASGVAVLLELSRVIPKLGTKPGVALVFFDAEDGGISSRIDGFCLGSKYMALNLPPELDFDMGINLDMIGDADLRLPYEANSLKASPVLTRSLWEIGAHLYPHVFVQSIGPAVYDDHIPFVAAGKAYINIIDFDYRPWHTLSDTADKCSAASLKAVGDTIVSLISQ